MVTKLNISKYFNTTTLIILTTISIGMLIRLILAWQTKDSPYHIYNDTFISILSPDPALYGYYATLLLEGLPHTSDVSMIEYVIYALVKFTPFSLDFVMYFAPALLASLVAIPVILILNFYTKDKTALFFAGIVSTIGYGFYSRTYLGYFDTDILNVFFPMMILYSMIMVIKKLDYRYALLGVIFNLGFLAWYHSSEPIVYAMNGFFVLFSLVFYLKKSELYKVIILFGISIIKIAFLYKFIALAVLFVGFYFVRLDYRYFLALFLLAIVGVLYKIDLNIFSIHLDRYLFKSESFQSLNYKFLSPMQLVAEAQGASFDDIVKVISGNIVIFGLSLLGYLFLLFRHKEFLLSLPLLAIGLLSIYAGVRFHIYGVSILVLGYFYLSYILSLQLKKDIAKSIFIILLALLPLYENYKSIEFWNTKVAQPVLYPEQIKALDIMTKQASKKDYIVTWWDYGWPLWYYTGMKTMIDNGRHHEDNFTVAQILMSQDQTFAYNAIHHFYDLYSKQQTPAIIQALNNNKDPLKLFEKLEQSDMTHAKNVDKYLFLPLQMTKLIYTIFTFANVDPTTGKKLPQKLFLEYNQIGENNDFILLDKGVKIDKKNALVIQGDTKIPVKKFYHIIHRNNQKLLKEIPAYPQGLHLVNYEGKYYMMDDYFFNTLFIQLIFFNNYDPKYFEPVYTGVGAAIYKLK
jgi:hypothetical protein